MSGAVSQREALKEFIRSLKVLPKLMVLDIDYTVWELHVDMCSPPFKLDKKGGAVDRYGEKLRLFKDVKIILSTLEEQGIPIAAASSTTEPPSSRELMGVLEIEKFFTYREIYPTRKFKHFTNIQQASGVDYKDMLFFDDEYYNIRDISTLGVTCYYIEDQEGLTMDRVRTGLQEFNDKHSTK